jgi:hypothetical protein
LLAVAEVVAMKQAEHQVEVVEQVVIELAQFL